MQDNIGEVIVSLNERGSGEVLDVFGPTVEIVTSSDDFCVIRGVVPPGVSVPLHRHADSEDFYIMSGTHQVLVEGPDGLTWHDAVAGDYVRIPGHTPHAHRNVGTEPAVDLIITTPRMGQFFRAIGRPVIEGLQEPTAAEVSRFVQVAAEYGYVLGTPDENAAVGIKVPPFPA